MSSTPRQRAPCRRSPAGPRSGGQIYKPAASPRAAPRAAPPREAGRRSRSRRATAHSPARPRSAHRTSGRRNRTCGTRRARHRDRRPRAARRAAPRRIAGRRSARELALVDAGQHRASPPAMRGRARACRPPCPTAGTAAPARAGEPAVAVRADLLEVEIAEGDVRQPSPSAGDHGGHAASYSSFGHGDGSGTGHNGKPAAVGLRLTSSWRTACIATRSAVSSKVVSSAVTSTSGRAQACSAHALSLPEAPRKRQSTRSRVDGRHASSPPPPTRRPSRARIAPSTDEATGHTSWGGSRPLWFRRQVLVHPCARSRPAPPLDCRYARALSSARPSRSCMATCSSPGPEVR